MMTVRTDLADTTTQSVVAQNPSSTTDPARLYREGMVAGLIGAATVAVWFLILDTINGRPLSTPTLLGTALFRPGAGLASPETLPVSLEMVAMFTWVHALVFVGLGGLASRLLGLADRNPSFGFGVLLLFAVFQFGFIVVAMLLAAPILHALTWPAILAANVLATGTMGGYFWLRHPALTVSP
jgi:hypothetical protein